MRGIKFLAILCMLVTCNKNTVNTSFSSDQAASEKSTENFVPEKTTHDKLDILLVIDESGSMNPVHRTLSSRLEDLLVAVKDSDWQIAITTTSPLSCLLTVIDKNTPNYKQIFTETITQKSLQASFEDYSLLNYYGPEQAIYGAIRGLRGDCIAARSYSKEKTSIVGYGLELAAESRGGFNSLCNKKQAWVRDGSMLAVLLITDEDHQCIHHHGCHITDLYFYLKSIRVPHATGRVYGLLDTKAQGSSEPKGADRFLEWKDESGESLFDFYDSVFNNDYTKILTEISQNIAAALKNNFTLEHEHDGSRATVVITTEDGETKTLEEGQYSVEGNSLSISITLPANTTKIEVTYTH